MPVKSGADMEAALTRAKFRAAAMGHTETTRELIEQTFADFLPSTYPEEIELQNIAAVLECTSRELLPAAYRDTPRDELVTRLNDLKRRLGERS
jgi:hypothetical protein